MKSSNHYYNKVNEITNVSRETFLHLEKYVELLLKWNKSINIISRKTEGDIWQRHILDSAQIMKHLPNKSCAITDFGSGGGLPALVVAILTNNELHLVESDERKSAFLIQVTSELKLGNVTIHNDRIESLDAWQSDILMARALAPLSDLFQLLNKFVEKSNICLFMKGANVVKEIKEAQRNWQFEYCEYKSITDSNSVVLEVKNIKRKL